MFASTLQAVSSKTKHAPTLTTRAPSLSYRSLLTPTHLPLYKKSPQAIKSIKSQLECIYQHRVSLLPRDIQAIFDSHRDWCVTVLGFGSASEMFRECDRDEDGRLCEEEQMGIFVGLLARLYRKKEECIGGQMYGQHAEMLEVIKEVEGVMPQLETLIRSRITQIKQGLHQSRKIRALSEFDRKAETSQKAFTMQKEARLAFLKERQKEEMRTLEAKLEQSNMTRLYRARPSVKLRQTKDLVLLQRLSPYKSEKKRDYEGQSLNKTIAQAVLLEEERINKSIEAKKNLERLQLQKAHQKEAVITQQKIQLEEAQLLETLTHQKDVLRKSQDNLASVVLSKDRMEAANRINWIGRAVRSHREHSDSLNIARIVMRHRDLTQFNNSIEKLSTLASYNPDGIRNYRYLGSEDIQSTRRLLNQTIDVVSTDRDMSRLVKSPGKHLSDALMVEPVLQQQKSLTDLYDKDLNPIN